MPWDGVVGIADRVGKNHWSAQRTLRYTFVMPDYRRRYVPGGTYFFTLVTEGRAPLFNDERARGFLRAHLAAAAKRWPFEIEAIVLLPDHFHMVVALPAGDDNYSVRLAWIKKEFTKSWLAAGGAEQPVSDSRKKNRRRGVLQRRFWEHTIRDEADFEAHVEYIHYNPVKHRLVAAPRDWPWSSFHRFVREGIYLAEWGTAGGAHAVDPNRWKAIADELGE